MRITDNPIIRVRNMRDIVDFIESHKKGHTVNVTRNSYPNREFWTIYIDNKKTQKRKVIYVNLHSDGIITGSYNILKGYNSFECSWGHKLHTDRVRMEMNDCGYFMFLRFINLNFETTYMNIRDGKAVTDYKLTKPLA